MILNSLYSKDPPETGEQIFKEKIPINEHLILKNKFNDLYYLYQDDCILLYSFDLAQGESLLITGQDSFRCQDINTGIEYEIPNNTVQVQKVENIEFGGLSLESISLDYGPYWNYYPSNIIFKNVGPKSTFLPQPVCSNYQIFNNLSYYSLGEILVCFSDGNTPDLMTDEDLCTELFTLTNVKNLASSSSIEIYPNPVRDILSLSGVPKNSNVELHNINGILVRNYTNVSDQITVSQLSPGIYFGKLQKNNISQSFKILKL